MAGATRGSSVVGASYSRGLRRFRDGRLFRGLEELSSIATLTIAGGRALLTPPYSWWRDVIDVSWWVLRRSFLPAGLAVFFTTLGPVAVLGGGVFELLGIDDRVASTLPIAAVREFGPFITPIVVAGVIGTSICADLGSRKVREELDAMAIMGVDPVKKLVAPRLLALVLVTPLLSVISIEWSNVAIYLTSIVFLYGVDPHVFFAAFAPGMTSIELLALVVKPTLIAIILAGIFCHAGLTAQGGVEGVGRAVNRSVVQAFVVIILINFAFNSALQGAFPELQALR